MPAIQSGAGSGTWEIVDVAPVHQQVSILGVTEGGHVARQGHAGTHVPPQGAWGVGRKGSGKSLDPQLLKPAHPTPGEGTRPGHTSRMPCLWGRNPRPERPGLLRGFPKAMHQAPTMCAKPSATPPSRLQTQSRSPKNTAWERASAAASGQLSPRPHPASPTRPLTRAGPPCALSPEHVHYSPCSVCTAVPTSPSLVWAGVSVPWQSP